MKPRYAFVLGLLMLAALVFPARASAQFIVCNHTSQDKINLAITVTWFDVVNGGRVLDELSWGWYSIAKGACTTLVTNNISNDDIYIYAYSASNPSVKWADKYNFCMDPKNNFSYKGVAQVKPPCSSGGSAFPTMYIETSGTPGIVDPNGSVRPIGLPEFTLNLEDKK